MLGGWIDSLPVERLGKGSQVLFNNCIALTMPFSWTQCLQLC
jgi:hypothetical protein